MALERGRAQIGQDARLGLLFRWDSRPADPHNVRQVEILATDGETVIVTLDVIEHEPTSGEYYATVPAQYLTQVGRLYDRWYYTWVNEESEQTVTQDFYVHEAIYLEHYGPDIHVGVGYLKGLPALAPSAQDGITQADLELAMEIADAMVESIFCLEYDISAWRTSPPALITIIWQLLASAKVLEFRDLRLGLPGESATSTAAPLLRSARELVDKILHGWPERLHLRDSDGNVIRPRKNRVSTVPRASG